MSDIPLREYVDRCIQHERETRELQWGDALVAMNLARGEINRRLEDMNELRQQITSERGQFLPRELFDRMHSLFEDRLRSLENDRANLQGRMWIGGALLLMIQLGLAIAGFWLHK